MTFAITLGAIIACLAAIAGFVVVMFLREPFDVFNDNNEDWQ